MRTLGFFFLVMALAFTVSCAHKGSRAPQSEPGSFALAVKVMGDLNNSNVFNASTCASYLRAVTDQVYAQPASYLVASGATSNETLKQNGPQMVRDFFEMRLKLRDRMISFENAGTLTDECRQAIKRGFRYLRYSEDLLIEWLQEQKIVSNDMPTLFEGRDPNTMINRKFRSANLQAGDVLWIRGGAHISAMIARIGDEEAQFSHLAIIGQDKAGRLYLVEALAQQGTVVTPLVDYLKGRPVRAVLFRQPDAALAVKAARNIYDRAAPAFAKGKNIPYDFALDDSESESLYCAEVISSAYRQASGDQFMVPSHRTSVRKFKGTTFLDAMGITTDEIFAPADIETDARFELVAEYRNIPALRGVRMQDAVLSSAYKWIIEEGYVFDETSFRYTAKALLAKTLRTFGWLEGSLLDYMPLGFMTLVLEVESVHNVMMDNLREVEKAYFRQNQHSLSIREMMLINEEFRKRDCASEEQKMHSVFSNGHCDQ